MIIDARHEQFRFNNLHKDIDEEGASGDSSDDGDEVRKMFSDHMVDDEHIIKSD